MAMVYGSPMGHFSRQVRCFISCIPVFHAASHYCVGCLYRKWAGSVLGIIRGFCCRIDLVVVLFQISLYLELLYQSCIGGSGDRPHWLAFTICPSLKSNTPDNFSETLDFNCATAGEIKGFRKIVRTYEKEKTRGRQPLACFLISI